MMSSRVHYHRLPFEDISDHILAFSTSLSSAQSHTTPASWNDSFNSNNSSFSRPSTLMGITDRVNLILWPTCHSFG